MAEQTNSNEDPCAVDNPASRWAFVWAFVTIVGGSFLVYQGSKIDRWMYDNNARVLDYDAYEENRLTATSIGVGGIDERRFPLASEEGE